MSKADCVSLPLRIQILQGNARGHSGIRRHERRVLRQRQTMATWNQPELWRCVPNIRWVCRKAFCHLDILYLKIDPTLESSARFFFPVWRIVRSFVLTRGSPAASPWKYFLFSVGNKNDDPNSKVVETTDAQKFAEQMGINLFETSAKENINVEEVTHCLCCRRLKCLCGVVSGTCLVCRAARLKAWIRQACLNAL